MVELLNPSEDILRARGPISRFWAELHSRIATPFLSFSYAFIALAAILAGAFNRRGMAGHILIGAVAIIVTQAAFMTLNGFIARDSRLALILYVVAVLPTLIGMAFMFADSLEPRFLPRFVRKVLP